MLQPSGDVSIWRHVSHSSQESCLLMYGRFEGGPGGPRRKTQSRALKAESGSGAVENTVVLFTSPVRNGVQASVQADLVTSPPTCPVALPPKPAGKTVPCDRFEAVPLIPMQLVMAAAQIRGREHLQMLKLPVIMQLQDQPLPRPPNTIHNVACAPFQAITFGDALLLCSSSMHSHHTLNYLQICVSGTPAAQSSALRAR